MRTGGGSNQLEITVTYDAGNLEGLQTSGTLSGRVELIGGKPIGISQPQNGGDWTWVDGNEYFGTKYSDEEGFYMMKYEARDDGGAVSRPEGQPWTSITFNNALTECQALSNSNMMSL